MVIALELEMFAFCVITFKQIQTCLAPQNGCLNLSFAKDIHMIDGKWPEIIVERPFDTLFRFPKKEGVTTRWRSLQIISWSLFEWLILTKCHSKISIYPQKLSNEINEKALVIQTNLKFFNPKQQNLWNFSMVKWRKFKHFTLCYKGIIISNLIILLVP